LFFISAKTQYTAVTSRT